MLLILCSTRLFIWPK